MPAVGEPLCPVCKSKSCYHCWECHADLASLDHHLFCSHYYSLQGSGRCVACGGSGTNSKGRECFPCGGTGKQSVMKEKAQ